MRGFGNLGDRWTTLTAKRAYFENDETFEAFLSKIFERELRGDDRIVAANDGRSFVFAPLERNSLNEGVFLRILEFSNGATGLVNLSFPTGDVDVEEILPPDQKKFLHTQIILLVKGNFIYSCGLGNRNTQCVRAVQAIAERAEINEARAVFKIADLPSKISIAEIERIGVKEVTFSIVEYLENFPASNVPKLPLMQSMFAQAKDIGGHHKRASTIARIKLKHKKFKKDERQRDEWLTDVGVAVLEDGEVDDFSIELDNGKKVHASNLKRQKRVKVASYGNTIKYLSAKNVLIDFSREPDEDEFDVIES